MGEATTLRIREVFYLWQWDDYQLARIGIETIDCVFKQGKGKKVPWSSKIYET
jgi:hypothetical protein